MRLHDLRRFATLKYRFVSACAGATVYGILAPVDGTREEICFRVDFTTAGNCYGLRLGVSRAVLFLACRLVFLLVSP